MGFRNSRDVTGKLGTDKVRANPNLVDRLVPALPPHCLVLELDCQKYEKRINLIWCTKYCQTDVVDNDSS